MTRACCKWGSQDPSAYRVEPCPDCPNLTPELLRPTLKAAFDIAAGDDASFDALIRKLSKGE